MPSLVLAFFNRPLRIRRAIAFFLFLPVSLLGHSEPLLPSSQSVLSRPAPRFLDRFVAAAMERTHHIVRYDPAYVRIPYPGGDVPPSTGVCTDEVIRAYRAVGIDLQKEVHEDMATHISAYPRKWKRSASGANSATDPNIDHRRVPNLMVFFARHGQSLPPSPDASDYRPGDLVTWNLGGLSPTSELWSAKSRRRPGATSSSTTSARARKWRMCSSTGESSVTIAIWAKARFVDLSGRTVELSCWLEGTNGNIF
jgi:uncharacterized protein YijF (DUF1287 family)